MQDRGHGRVEELRHQRCVGRRGRITLIGGILACLLIGAPAAHAAFTSTIRAGNLAVGTHQLATPTGNTVIPLCIPNGSSGKSRVSVTVSGYGTVPKATHYVLTVSDETGVRYTADLKPGVPTVYAPTSGAPSTTWNYSISAQYRVPSTGVIWKSNTPAIRIC